LIKRLIRPYGALYRFTRNMELMDDIQAGTGTDSPQAVMVKAQQNRKQLHSPMTFSLPEEAI
jgi:hypothetical protein